MLKAIRVVPHGRQPGMKPIVLRGVVEIDPYRDDFFKVLIEQRKANESDKTLKHVEGHCQLDCLRCLCRVERGAEV